MPLRVAKYPFLGITFTLHHRELWLKFAILLLIALAAVIAADFATFLSSLLKSLDDKEHGSFISTLPASFLTGLKMIFLALQSGLALIVLSIIFFRLFLGGFFDDVFRIRGLADGLVDDNPRKLSMGERVVCMVWLMVIQLATFLLLIPLNVLPVVGTLIWLGILGFEFAWGFHQYYFSLCGLHFEQQWKVVYANLWDYAVFGGVCLLLNLVPFFNVFLIQTSIVGAAVWAADIEEERLNTEGFRHTVVDVDFENGPSTSLYYEMPEHSRGERGGEHPARGVGGDIQEMQEGMPIVDREHQGAGGGEGPDLPPSAPPLPSAEHAAGRSWVRDLTEEGTEPNPWPERGEEPAAAAAASSSQTCNNTRQELNETQKAAQARRDELEERYPEKVPSEVEQMMEPAEVRLLEGKCEWANCPLKDISLHRNDENAKASGGLSWGLFALWTFIVLAWFLSVVFAAFGWISHWFATISAGFVLLASIVAACLSSHELSKGTVTEQASFVGVPGISADN